MNYSVKRLALMPYAKACIVTYEDGTIFLVSYKTPVIKIDKDGWLYCTGLYSSTTIKHISAFMREIVKYPNGKEGSYYDAKNAYIEHYKFNIHTGEIIDLK